MTTKMSKPRPIVMYVGPLKAHDIIKQQLEWQLRLQLRGSWTYFYCWISCDYDKLLKSPFVSTSNGETISLLLYEKQAIGYKYNEFFKRNLKRLKQAKQVSSVWSNLSWSHWIQWRRLGTPER